MFPDNVVEEARQHAYIKFPRECCGIVVDNKYVRCVNLAEGDEEFRISPTFYAKEYAEGRLQAVIHSHTNGSNHPSIKDQIQQQAMGIPWGIIVMDEKGRFQELFFYGDQVEIPPLLERPFRWAVHDCYGLVRDWYRVEKGILLKNFVRRKDWVDTGVNLFLEHFKEAGFVEVDDLKEVGDCVLASTSTPRGFPDICGVHIGGGWMMYHPTTGLSRKKYISMEDKKRYITHYLRYVG